MTINEVVNEVISKYGKDILLDGTRFCSIISDIAPKMEQENRVIRRLNQEKLLAEIYKIKTKSHVTPEDISRLLVLLEHSGFSEEWKRGSLEAFSLSEINNTKRDKLPSDRSNNDSNTVNESRTNNSFNLNGLYYHLASKDNNRYSINCLRFYADGRVVYTSVCLDSIDQLRKVATWLTWETDRMYKGHYNISEDKLIEFDIESPSGNVIIRYEGYRRESDLLLNSHSFINNHDGKNRIFKYFALDGVPKDNIQYKTVTPNDLTFIPTVGPLSVFNDGHYSYKENAKNIQLSCDFTEIGELTFEGNDTLEKVIVPYTVKKIGYKAFSDCINLESIELSNSVSVIGTQAFSGNPSLKMIDIPDSVEEIGSEAFAWCSELKEVTLPKNLKVVTGGMFYMDMMLEKIIIPDSVTKIGDSAFDGCYNLKKMYIPKSVISFGNNCFDRLHSCVFYVQRFSKAYRYIKKTYPRYRIEYGKI